MYIVKKPEIYPEKLPADFFHIKKSEKKLVNRKVFLHIVYTGRGGALCSELVGPTAQAERLAATTLEALTKTNKLNGV